MPRAPSLKSLEMAFPQQDMDNLRKIRAIIQSGRVRMPLIDRLLENHGVEYITDRKGDVVAYYSNSGDSYASTIMYIVGTGTYRLTTVGDFVETFERRNGRLP